MGFHREAVLKKVGDPWSIPRFSAESTALHYSNVREGQPWEMLYADDLVLVGKCEEELKEKLRKWNECLKDKGLK